MRKALALLALAVGLSACGGGSTEGPGQDGGTVATPTAAPRARGGNGGNGRPATQNCTDAGITTPPYNEGTCVQRGTRFVVVNGRSVMSLRTLDASLRGFSVADAIPGPNGEATPQGAFLLVRLSIQNTTGQVVRFAPNQTLLELDGEQFQERTDVEENTHRGALAFSSRDPIAPGETAEGAVVFDIPVDAIERVTARGHLLLANFDGNPPGKQREFGQFRVYRQ